MIRTRELVPDVYYNKSRDFQVLGRTFDVIFNYLKNTSSNVFNFTNGEYLDEKLVDLMCLTLGFKQLHSYNIEQLSALCSIFQLAIRNKGNINGIEMILNMLLRVEGISKDCTVVYKYDTYTLVVYIPIGLKDLTLFYDILSYLLPAGVNLRLVQQELIEESATTESRYTINIKNKNNALVKAYVDSQIPTYQSNVEASDLGPRDDNSTVIGYEEEVK